MLLDCISRRRSELGDRLADVVKTIVIVLTVGRTSCYNVWLAVLLVVDMDEKKSDGENAEVMGIYARKQSTCDEHVLISRG